MAKAHPPEVLARNVFRVAMAGIAIQILVVVLLIFV